MSQMEMQQAKTKDLYKLKPMQASMLLENICFL